MLSLINKNIQITDDEYKYLLESPKLGDEREFVENLWKKYEPFADKHFQTEIGISFHNRFWEMYLACSLMEYGFELIQLKNTKRPDVYLKINEKTIWIEAIAPKSGDGVDSIHEPKLEVGKFNFSTVPEEKIILRYRSAIQEKFNKYKEYLMSSIVKPNDSYIIAVNGRRVPYSILEDDIPYIIKSVLPFGDETVTINFDDNSIIDQGYSYRPEIKKIRGAPISTCIFSDPNFSGISGILFSNTDLLNRPQKFGADFIFVHNPLAKNPLPKGWLTTGREYRVNNNILEVKNWNKDTK